MLTMFRHFYSSPRTVLAGFLALACLMSAPAQAQSPAAGAQFSPGFVDDLAKKLSKQPYDANANAVPEMLRNLDAKSYSAINFKPERAFFGEGGSMFRAQLYHLGYLYNRAARVNLVTNATSYGVPYSPDLFDFGDTPVPRLPAETGYAGLRLHYPLNSPGVFDEMLSFLGASNFRPLGRGQRYGLHARGVAIDTALTSGEEFPYFREFWIETPGANASAIFVHALLDSPSLTGAYHFKITPGEDTTLDISAMIFARKPIKKLGLAPLASMFFYGETNRRAGDFRPEVHNSDGLMIHNGAGEWLWRPLRNPGQLAISSFMDRNPRGFGLKQRDRQFDHYQDLNAGAELRASYWVEPLGDWGDGAIELAEIPTPDETNDNIIAYWVPQQKMKAGESRTLSYRIHALENVKTDQTHPGGKATATYQQRLGDDGRQRFLVEFSGGDLRYYLKDPASVEAIVTASGGEVQAVQLQPNPNTGGFRAVFDVITNGEQMADLRAYLRARGGAITETWILPVRAGK